MKSQRITMAEFISIHAWIASIFLLLGCSSEQLPKSIGSRKGYVYVRPPHKIKSSHRRSIPSSPTETVEYFERLHVYGDFDGNGSQDTLYESVVSNCNQKPIDSIVFSYRDPFDSWGELIAATCRLDPKMSLKCTGLKELKFDLSAQLFGLSRLVNIGNVDNDGGDEIAFVIDHADFSNLNSCHIYSYTTSGWQRRFRFPIHELSIDYELDEDLEIKNILEPYDSAWYFHPYEPVYGFDRWLKLDTSWIIPAHIDKEAI